MLTTPDNRPIPQRAHPFAMSSRYLDPKVDLAFKRVFGEHEHLLRSFLNAMLPLPEDALIERLEYLNTEQTPEIPGFKNSIVDVKCVDAQGRIFIVEMQMMWKPSFESRLVFGASQAFVKQLKAGEGYRALQPVYALALINDWYNRAVPEFYHHFKITNVQNTGATLEGLQFVLIELPKFKAANFSNRRMQVLWLRFLKEIGQDGVEPDAEMLASAEIAEALALMEVSRLNTQQLDAYHADLDRARIEISVMEDAREEGVAMGKAMGKEMGRAEGKADMIKALHTSGMPTEQIAAIAQLSQAEVQCILQR